MQTMRLQDVVIRRFSIAHDESSLPGLVTCYRRVFAGFPWNEWRKCSVCGLKWGINNFPIPSVHCGESVIECWPQPLVESKIRKKLVGNLSCWCAFHNEDIVGFCWGYAISPIKLEEKLESPGIADAIDAFFGTQDLVAYQNEIGVLEKYRGNWLAKSMYMARHGDFMSQGLRIGVARTQRTPPTVTYNWFSRIGYRVVGEYRGKDDIVILARSIVGLHFGA